LFRLIFKKNSRDVEITIQAARATTRSSLYKYAKVLVYVKMELPPNSTQKKNPRDMVIGALIARETVVIF
jgi:hypothetical protein